MTPLTKVRLDEGESITARMASIPSASRGRTELEAPKLDGRAIQRFVFHDNRWVTSSFSVEDRQMKDVLRAAFHRHQDHNEQPDIWTFASPFKMIVWCWTDLRTQYRSIEDAEIKKVAGELRSFLWPILVAHSADLAGIARTKKVAFKGLSEVFNTGDRVATTLYGVEAICRVQSFTGGKTFSRVNVECLDWNGESFGYATTEVTILKYDGDRRVDFLPVHPVAWRSDRAQLQVDFTCRGRKFEALSGHHFCAYNGNSILLDTGKPEKHPIDARVIVDARAYYACNRVTKPALSPREHDDATFLRGEQQLETPQMVVNSRADGRMGPHHDLTDEECMLCTPWVMGMELETNKWAQFYVYDLAPVVWADDAFDKLVIPAGEKQLVWNLVESKMAKKAAVERGLTIHIFGPSGVGKTHAVKAMAERARVPCYTLHLDDLATDPKTRDMPFKEILDKAIGVCEVSNTILVLDSFDVYLKARPKSSLSKDELFSALLSPLASYTGICFIVARDGTADESANSAIDVPIHLREFTLDTRRQI